MRDEEHGSALFAHLGLHALQAFGLETGVAHGQNFIHHQNIGMQMRGYGKAQTHFHPARIVLDWVIHVLVVQTSKFLNGFHALRHLWT